MLTSCDLISEGLDVPNVSAVILLRPTKSLTLYLQQVGRGMRPAPGKAALVVLDHVGNVIEHGLPDQEPQWSLSGVEKVKKHSRKSELAQAFRYMRARWTALVRCFDDGRLALDNNPAERALRCVAIGRKNYLFAGSDAGGRRAAAIYSLIESAKLNGLNPQHYLADVLARIADHPARRIAELLPWNWQPLDATRAAA